MSFHIFKDAAGQWRWYLLSDNHRKIAISAEGYYHRIDCVAAIRMIMTTSEETPIYED